VTVNTQTQTHTHTRTHTRTHTQHTHNTHIYIQPLHYNIATITQHTGIFLPLLLVSSTYTYILWSRRDYYWNKYRTTIGTGKDARRRENPLSYVKVLVDFVRCKHPGEEYVIFISVSITVVLCSLLGIVFNIEATDQTFGLIITDVVAILIASVFFLLKWFNTFTIGKLAVVLLSALDIHLCVNLSDVGLEAGIIVGMYLLILLNCMNGTHAL